MPDRLQENEGVIPLSSSRSTESDRLTSAPAARLDFHQLSGGELDETLRTLLETAPVGPDVGDRLQRLVHELQVQRCELEMQNRALREAQAELEHSVHRYADLYDSLPLGYLTLTPQGRIVEANRTAAEMLGMSREQLSGMYLRHFFSPADGVTLTAHLLKSAEHPDRQVAEVTLERRRTTPLPVQLSSHRTQLEEGVFVRMALTDVSELKEAQRVLRDMVAEQESFAYSISHDLRAPLLTISTFSKVLAEDVGELSSAESIDIVHRIRRAACRMDDLLQNMLEYSRVSRAQTRLEEVPLAEIVKDVLVQHQGVIKERQARIEVQEPLPSAGGARPLLSQVLSNLLTNALKYTPPDRQPVVRIGARETERTVVLRVEDEGIGIAPEHQERIFRMFERLHGVSEYPGTGIGLALVRRAAERMRGRVWVESQEGKGSCFYLELPKPGGA